MAYTPPALPYYGPVAHTSGTGNLPINRVVIHCTAGSDAKGAQGTAAYFRNPGDPDAGSAHYITDSDEAIQCARDNVVCWHAPPNTHSLGIEMECSLAGNGEGHWERADHIAMMKITAKLTAQKCLQYGVPIVKLTVADLRAGKRGICGHADVSLAFGQSTHTDPERYFPWAQFMAWVRAAASTITGSTPTPPAEDDMAGEGPAILAAVQDIQAKSLSRYQRSEVIATASMNVLKAQSAALATLSSLIKAEDVADDAALQAAIAAVNANIDALESALIPKA